MNLASTPPASPLETPDVPASTPAPFPVPSLATLIVLMLGFRFVALFLVRYGGAAPDWSGSDFRYYHELADLAAQGFLPEIHYWVEYPPIFPWIAVGAFHLSQLLPPWPQPYFWFDLFLSTVLAAADAGSIVAIDRLGDAIWGRPAGRRSAAIYAAAFAPAWAVFGWFDTLPTCFLLTTLTIIVSNRDLIGVGPGAYGRGRLKTYLSSRALRASALAGFTAGIGIMLKIFPILAVPAALVVGRDPPPGNQPTHRLSVADLVDDPRTWNLAVAVVSAALTALVVVLPFYLIGHDMVVASFRNIAVRRSWESPWALLDGYTGTGLVAALRDRVLFAESANWGQPIRYPGVWWLAALISATLFAWRTIAARRVGTPRAAIALTGFGVTLLLLLSRGFSPQFTLWILPFIVLFLPGFEGAILAVVLTFNNLVLEAYLYVTLFHGTEWLLYVDVALRTVILLWLLVEFGAAIDESSLHRWHGVRRRFRFPAMAVLLGAAVLVVGVAWPSVRASTIDRAAAGPLVEALKGGTPAAAVIFTQPQVYDRLAWVVRPRQAVLVAEPKFLEWTGDHSLNARLNSALRDAPEVTVLTDTTGTDSGLVPAINRWLEAHYGRRPDQTLGPIQLSDFRASERAVEKPLDARFGDQLELRGFSPSTLTVQPGQLLAVTLHWFTRSTIDRDYTISLQLLNPNGSLAVQHDAMPVDNSFPTSTWTAGLDVYDRIELPLPPGLQPGTYSLIVIAYDQPTSSRLPVTGSGANGDHATIAAVAFGT